MLRKKIRNAKFATCNNKFYMLVIILLVLSFLSTMFLDANVFVFVNQNLSNEIDFTYRLDKSLVYRVITSEELLLCVAGLFSIFTLLCLFKRTFSKLTVKLIFLFVIYQLLSLCLLNYVKIFLKYIFARCVPEVCLLYNISLDLSPYGFNFFSTRNGFVSFPSGHCMILSYALMWSFYFNSYLKILVLALFSIVFVSLILFNYHFLGDCFSGTCFGLIFGYISILIWKLIPENYLLK
ncbi:MAG: phosphatase PAP2 family protein [Proteobacteria bacterium]|nr:MAG: phosphatase PAP2 family protein [Pseudomonadota bacterium]